MNHFTNNSQMGDNKKTTRKGDENDDVEQLLRQTQDEILLKLSLNSHTTSRSIIIDPDLDRRFNALKRTNHKHPTTTTVDPTPKAKAANAPDDVIISDNDLFARFSALKNSKNKSSCGGGATSQDSFVQKQLKLTEFEDDGDDDEVEKLIKWAVDAARLDPSPPSDDDDDEDSDDGGNKCKRK